MPFPLLNTMQTSTRQNILLLTATITPPSGVPNLKRIDPKVRLEDYKQALCFYLALVNQGCDAIVFAENSNSDVSELRELVEQYDLSRQVEFVSFYGLDYPPSYDRGYGEFKLLDYAMQHSTLITNQAEHSVVWKVTGRYVVKNLCQMIARQPPQFDLYCNFRNYPKHWVDTFLMAWTPQGYENCLKEVYQNLKLNVPGVPPKAAAEELLRAHFNRLTSEIHIKSRFNTTPYVHGARAADNMGYSSENLWKYRVRSLMNTWLPWLWI